MLGGHRTQNRLRATIVIELTTVALVQVMLSLRGPDIDQLCRLEDYVVNYTKLTSHYYFVSFLSTSVSI